MLDLTLFAHVVKRSDADLDLGQAALLIADATSGGVDVAHYVTVLDELAARAAIAPPRSDAENESAMKRLLDFIYGVERFRGNQEDYYDPRNSCLDQVLDRRLGIPITLAIVVLEVARRCEITARGVSFPGHFLVRAPGAKSTLFVDPFDGKVLSGAELRALHGKTTGEARDPDPRVLEPADKQQILIRMLNNLRAIWEERSDEERLQAVEERLEILKGGAPSRSTFKS